MRSKKVALGLMFVLASPFGIASDTKTSSTTITAEEVANRNAEARGGLQAWLRVQSLSESGTLTVGGDQRRAETPEIPGAKRPASAQPIPSTPRLKQEARLPFHMEMERPRKIRFELQFKGQKAVQVYDGSAGWKYRPYLNRVDVEPYTADEIKLASTQSDLDGPLMNYAAKGTRIELEGTEKIEGQNTYKLKLTMKQGNVLHVWINAQTFLEAKVEGQPRRLDGKEHPVEIYYRDYRKVNGMEFPFLLETRVLPSSTAMGKLPQVAYPAEQIAIETIVVNPNLEASRFTKPEPVAEVSQTKRQSGTLEKGDLQTRPKTIP